MDYIDAELRDRKLDAYMHLPAPKRRFLYQLMNLKRFELIILAKQKDIFGISRLHRRDIALKIFSNDLYKLDRKTTLKTLSDEERKIYDNEEDVVTSEEEEEPLEDIMDPLTIDFGD